MSQTEDQLFFSLLRYGLWSTPIPVDGVDLSAVNWGNILEQFMRQSLQGIGSEAVIAHKDLFGLTKEQQRPFLQQAGGITRRNLFMNADVVKLFTHLQANGYHPVLLKGQGNATFYRNPLNRAPGDIDVYIGEEDYERAKNEFRESADFKFDASFHETDKHFNCMFCSCEVEFHQAAVSWRGGVKIYGNALCAKWLDNPSNFSSVSVNGQSVAVPSPQFNVLYIFAHLWFHFIGCGIGLRHLCDWAMALHSAGGHLDLRQLELDLKSLKLYRPWQVMGTILVNKLGLPTSEFPFHEPKYEKLMNFIVSDIMSEGNFGKYGDRMQHSGQSTSFIDKKSGSFIYGTRRFCSLWKLDPYSTFWGYVGFVKDAFRRM